MNHLKFLLIFLLLLLMLLFLTGCRVRTTAPSGSDTSGTLGNGSGQGAQTPSDDAAFSGNDSSTEINVDPDNDGKTTENPESSRKEYDASASAEIISGAEKIVHSSGDGGGAYEETIEETRTADKIQNEAEKTVTQTVSVESSSLLGISDNATLADSMMSYYTVLLNDRSGSLFECKRLNVYWEDTATLETVSRSSPEHELIRDAGCYNVASRLLPQNLTVDSDWVVRKNPDVLVKVVPSTVLGPGVLSDTQAKAAYSAFKNREGWQNLSGILQNKILLLSEDLLTAPHLQLAAALFLAKTANPDLYSDIDCSEVLSSLSEEVTGSALSGLYYYTEQE